MGLESLSSCIVVRSRVSSCLFEYLLSIGRSIPMIRQSRNGEPGLQPFLFDSIYTYSGNGTTDDNWWVFLMYRVRLIFSFFDNSRGESEILSRNEIIR